MFCNCCSLLLISTYCIYYLFLSSSRLLMILCAQQFLLLCLEIIRIGILYTVIEQATLHVQHPGLKTIFTATNTASNSRRLFSPRARKIFDVCPYVLPFACSLFKIFSKFSKFQLLAYFKNSIY